MLKYLRLIIVLMVISLVGIISLQYHWIDTLYSNNEKQFEYKVYSALQEVSNDLEKINTAYLINQNVRKPGVKAKRRMKRVQIDGEGRRVEEQIETKENGTVVRKIVTTKAGERDESVLKFNHESDSVKEEGWKQIIITENGVQASFSEDIEMKIEDDNVNVWIEILRDSAKANGEGARMIKGLAADFSLMMLDAEVKFNPELIDSLLTVHLANTGIETDFHYEVVLKDSAKAKGKALNHFRQTLYSSFGTGGERVLDVNFPSKRGAILKEMAFALISSFLFIGLIIFCFTYTISTILKQKKYSEITTDFINNMTHEFKTPVSTIMLATQAIKEVKVEGDVEKVHKLANIISQENKRIETHVERVLKAAVMENNELSLNITPINLTDLVLNTLPQFEFLVEKVNGKLISEINKDSPVFVNGEAYHLESAISNVLDNALKYSKNNPEITVEMRDKDNFIELSITDKGIGIEKNNLNKIFDKFYRVHTGNLHDVKGFGLGLHYVKKVFDLHHGEIEIKSNSGQGTQVILTLPKSK